jgi:hypothetical protein
MPYELEPYLDFILTATTAPPLPQNPETEEDEYLDATINITSLPTKDYTIPRRYLPEAARCSHVAKHCEYGDQ